MDDADLWRFITLLPIPGRTTVPLHRVLAHTMWRRAPLAAIRYDRDRDHVFIRMVDAPTVAEAVVRDPDDPSRDERAASRDEYGQFIGFDGTDPGAWLTVVAFPGFGRRRGTSSVALTLLRKLCGEHVWQAALAAAYGPVGRSAEVPVGQQETSMLIDRWRNMIAPPRVTEASYQELAGWIATDPSRLGEQFPVQRDTGPNLAVSEPNGWPKREPR